MPLFVDQLGREVEIPVTPKRIISLVPSQTELLFYLGLDDDIAGITKFCTHPAGKVSGITKIGGTKQLNMQLIHKLQPGLIIANKEENERTQVEELMKHYPVWISDIGDLPGALDMITKVGAVVNRATQASMLVQTIRNRFNNLQKPQATISTAYFIWRKPYMVAGRDTYIDSLLQLCGFINVFDTPRYPELTAAELAAANPQLILLSSEPYPFAQKHIDEFKAIVPAARIILVDGEMFSWYGSRLLYAPDYFNKLIKAGQVK